MSAKIINLRRARKAKARAEDRAAGDENALRFGEAKVERARRAKLDQMEARRREGTRIEKGEDRT